MENISYSLLWTTSVKSPCINSGYPGENNELTDPDGTPPDIGCVYYPHENREYFERHDPSGIYWLSFPVLDDRTCTDDTYWNELGYMFDDHMLGAPNSQLNQIQWSYDGDHSTVYYDNNIWQHSENRVNQPKGYIVQFNQGMQIDPVIVNGFKADPDLTPAMWEATAGTEPFENWIGYYVPYTQKAGDAFSRFLPGSDRFRYLDYIYSIKTQKWSTCRISDEPGSPWIGEPNKYTLSEGDMVYLLLFPDAPEEMYWATLTTPSDPIERPEAEAFAFEEELDYTPVFIEFDPGDLPDEVGLYVNGECKGASVVDSTLVDVCFYDLEDKESGEIEVIFHYGNKGKKSAKGWKIYNPDRLVFEDGSLRSGQIGNYAYLSFQHEDGESITPLVTILQPNHPNPFNPSTTISFVLGRDMDARLDIYNVRGQRVNTLQNGLLAKGRHTFEWNGRDEQGSPVASGVYFSRLITPDGSFVNKMMLMK
ncbi:MAG: FlgD immunoglobulin-like domain containing protein [Candidatus Syntrophosphaera sp.]